jgi:hypothetical protein
LLGAGRALVQLRDCPALTVTWGRPFAKASVMPMRSVLATAAWAAVRVKVTRLSLLTAFHCAAGRPEAVELPTT